MEEVDWLALQTQAKGCCTVNENKAFIIVSEWKKNTKINSKQDNSLTFCLVTQINFES